MKKETAPEVTDGAADESKACIAPAEQDHRAGVFRHGTHRALRAGHHENPGGMCPKRQSLSSLARPVRGVHHGIQTAEERAASGGGGNYPDNYPDRWEKYPDNYPDRPPDYPDSYPDGMEYFGSPEEHPGLPCRESDSVPPGHRGAAAEHHGGRGEVPSRAFAGDGRVAAQRAGFRRALGGRAPGGRVKER